MPSKVNPRLLQKLIRPAECLYILVFQTSKQVDKKTGTASKPVPTSFAGHRTAHAAAFVKRLGALRDPNAAAGCSEPSTTSWRPRYQIDDQAPAQAARRSNRDTTRKVVRKKIHRKFIQRCKGLHRRLNKNNAAMNNITITVDRGSQSAGGCNMVCGN